MIRGLYIPLLFALVLLPLHLSYAEDIETPESEVEESDTPKEEEEKEVVALITGLYETSFQSGVIYGPDDEQDCPFPDEWDNLDWCIETYEATNSLGLIEHENGALEFGVSLTFFNGHSCGLNGLAEKVEDNHWLFTQLSENSEDNKFKSYEDCKLNITLNDNDIVLDADPEASCRSNCGARGHFSEISFPLTSKRSEAMTSERINCIGVISDDCNRLNKAP